MTWPTGSLGRLARSISEPVWLVDTNVLSAAAPTKAVPSPGLTTWMERNSDRLFLSVITVAEVEDGIAKARREGATRKAERLDVWLETVIHLYADRILPLDIKAARRLGALSDHARGAGVSPAWADLAIAATAMVNRYAILTKNIRHFVGLGVKTHDPFENLPS